MGRKKTYDRKQVLSAAVDSFWETGFSGTSMRALVASTGVSPKSLYAEFGDKEQLFISAIEAYIEDQASFYQFLTIEPFGMQRLRKHFRGYRFHDRFKGCLLINSLAEDAAIPQMAQERINEFFRYVKGLFRQHLAAARDAQEIATDASLSSLSEALLVFDQGLAIAGKSSTQRPHLRAATSAFLDSLAAGQPTSKR